MILVDSGVWIDYFRDTQTLQTAMLDWLTPRERIVTGDLVLVEVLQGTANDRAFRRVRRTLEAFDVLPLCDGRVAVAAAQHYRHLRSLGITPRKTIDTLIATRCILDEIPLLYSDRDFDPFVEHLGLISAMSLPGAS